MGPGRLSVYVLLAPEPRYGAALDRFLEPVSFCSFRAKPPSSKSLGCWRSRLRRGRSQDAQLRPVFDAWVDAVPQQRDPKRTAKIASNIVTRLHRAPCTHLNTAKTVQTSY